MSEKKPLEGVRVVDLTYYIAGPGSARILCDWGADVIKIEPLNGEPGRVTGVSLGLTSTEDYNPYFGVWNADKRAIALDLKSPEGVEVMNKLLSEANVFVTSFRPGALKRLGLDYETMSKKHPHIVWASINGFGYYGPAKDKAGFDTVAFWARSGAMMDLVQKDSGPINPTLGFGDATTACSLAGGICAGLYRQATTGRGSKVMVSLLAQAIWNLSAIITSAQIGDTYPKSRKSPSAPVVNSYQTSDGKWLFMSIFDYPKQYPAFLKAIDREDLLDNEKFNTSESSSVNSAEFVQIIEEQFAKYTQEEMIERLINNDIAHEPIKHAADILSDPQALENNYVIEITHRNGENSMCSMPPVKFANIDTKVENVTPLIGQHTEEVLKEIGYTDNEINKLASKDIVRIRKKNIESIA